MLFLHPRVTPEAQVLNGSGRHRGGLARGRADFIDCAARSTARSSLLAVPQPEPGDVASTARPRGHRLGGVPTEADPRRAVVEGVAEEKAAPWFEMGGAFIRDSGLDDVHCLLGSRHRSSGTLRPLTERQADGHSVARRHCLSHGLGGAGDDRFRIRRPPRRQAGFRGPLQEWRRKGHVRRRDGAARGIGPRSLRAARAARRSSRLCPSHPRALARPGRVSPGSPAARCTPRR